MAICQQSLRYKESGTISLLKTCVAARNNNEKKKNKNKSNYGNVIVSCDVSGFWYRYSPCSPLDVFWRVNKTIRIEMPWLYGSLKSKVKPVFKFLKCYSSWCVAHASTLLMYDILFAQCNLNFFCADLRQEPAIGTTWCTSSACAESVSPVITKYLSITT
jgi:hypothetical protein